MTHVLCGAGRGFTKNPDNCCGPFRSLTFVEMPEADYCCGGGGGLRVTNFEMARAVLNRKLSFLGEMEAEAIVTGCPMCIKQLTMGLSQQGRKMAVLHPAVVVAKAMGVV